MSRACCCWRVTFLGAAAALAHGDNAGVTFFVDRLPPRWRARVMPRWPRWSRRSRSRSAGTRLLLLQDTAGQTVGAGVPQELFFAPLCFAAAA